jgi:hypothetical protein
MGSVVSEGHNERARWEGLERCLITRRFCLGPKPRPCGYTMGMEL